MTCKQCGADIRHRIVSLDLGRIGGKHTFCCDACKHTFVERLLAEWSGALNSIFVRGRGLARDLARQALRLRA